MCTRGEPDAPPSDETAGAWLQLLPPWEEARVVAQPAVQGIGQRVDLALAHLDAGDFQQPVQRFVDQAGVLGLRLARPWGRTNRRRATQVLRPEWQVGQPAELQGQAMSPISGVGEQQAFGR